VSDQRNKEGTTQMSPEPSTSYWDGRGNAVLIYDNGEVHMQNGKVFARMPIEKWVEAALSFSEAVDERDALKRRLAAMFPLFQEARDALTAIPLASAKLHGIRLDLADRMDDVGVPDRWKAREEAAQ
jgi:hypothetical protein